MRGAGEPGGCHRRLSRPVLVFQPAPAGPVQLQAGSYSIRVLNLSCITASEAFSTFIGKDDLPESWTANVRTKTFIGKGGSFSVSLPGASGPGLGEARECPAFSVLRDDRIGSVVLPKGQYTLRPGGTEPLACLPAARLLAGALDDPAAGLSAPWSATDAPGSRPGMVLREPAGRSVLVRRVSGATAGGGRTAIDPPG
jgi:hypothetical protein